jgi:hypothetical protein
MADSFLIWIRLNIVSLIEDHAGGLLWHCHREGRDRQKRDERTLRGTV